MSNQYKCEVCKETFDTGWSDEEALAELKETFPGYEPPECSLVCDDCFQRIMANA